MSLLKDIAEQPDMPKRASASTQEPTSFSMIREFNVQKALKTSDGSDAGKSDVVDRAAAASDIGFNLMRNTINSSGSVTGSDVADYIERAEELNDEVDTVPFGLETDDGKIVKVYVNAEQADKFEEAMKNMLGLEDDIEEAINRLTTEFDIVDVVWPKSDDEDGDGVPDEDQDLEIDDTTNLELDPEDEADFADDQYDVVAAVDGDTPPEVDPGTGKAKAADAEDVEPSAEPVKAKAASDEEPAADDEEPADGEEDGEPEPDPDKPKKNKRKRKNGNPAPAEPATAAESRIPKGPVLNENNSQEKDMTIGTRFLERVLNEADAGEDRDGVKDGYNIPLDSQARAMAAKQKLPWAKRLVAFHFMCGVPGRYMNTSEVAEAVASSADMLRKKVAVRRAFSTLYEGLAAAKGYNIPTGDVKESVVVEAKNKRGSFIQKLLESVLIELGLPESLVITTGPAVVGTGIYNTAELIEQDSTLERSLRLLATRMGIKGQDAIAPVQEAKAPKLPKEKDVPIEVVGVKGMKSKPWRKVFKNQEAMEKWMDKNGEDITVHAYSTDRVNEEVEDSRFSQLSKMANKVDEAVDVGNDDFAQAVTGLIAALGIPDDILNRRRTQVVQALRAKRGELRNRAQVLTMIGRLMDVLQKNTVERGGASTDDNAGGDR